LKDTFPELYCIAQEKDAYVADHLQLRNGSINWELNFIPAVHDWDLESISTFFDLLYSANVKGQVRISFIGSILVQKILRFIHFIELWPHLVLGHFPWKSIWKAKVPPRVAFFIWTSSLGRILTMDNLR
jgi:hypothetical protein